jgi:hypothetical protein
MSVSCILESVFFRSRMLTVLLMGLTLALSAGMTGSRTRWLRYLTAAFAVLLAVTAVNWIDFNKPGGETLTQVLFAFNTPDIMLENLAQYGLFSIQFWLTQLPLFVWGCALLVSITLLYNLRRRVSPHTGPVLAVILGIGLGLLFLVSLSPTIYASGARTAFVFNLIQIFIIAALFKPLSETLPKPVIAFIYLFPVINLLLIAGYLNELHY